MKDFRCKRWLGSTAISLKHTSATTHHFLFRPNYSGTTEKRNRKQKTEKRKQKTENRKEKTENRKLRCYRTVRATATAYGSILLLIVVDQRLVRASSSCAWVDSFSWVSFERERRFGGSISRRTSVLERRPPSVGEVINGDGLGKILEFLGDCYLYTAVVARYVSTTSMSKIDAFRPVLC
jgi:hypothetical protein